MKHCNLAIRIMVYYNKRITTHINRCTFKHYCSLIQMTANNKLTNEQANSHVFVFRNKYNNREKAPPVASRNVQQHSGHATIIFFANVLLTLARDAETFQNLLLIRENNNDTFWQRSISVTFPPRILSRASSSTFHPSNACPDRYSS